MLWGGAQGPRPSGLNPDSPKHWFWGLGLRVLGFRVWGFGGLGFGVWGLGFGVWTTLQTPPRNPTLPHVPGWKLRCPTSNSKDTGSTSNAQLERYIGMGHEQSE